MPGAAKPPDRARRADRIDEAVQGYIDAIPAGHRPLFDRLHRLILHARPDVTVGLSYRMPAYSAGGRRLHLGAWKHGLSLYGWPKDSDGGFVARHPDRLPAALAAEQLRGAGRPGFVQALQALLDYDIRERLPQIACPTLIVWGASDRLITVRDADVFAELIPNSRKVVFEDTGHVSMLERPAAFNALLRDFLAE